MPSYLYNVSNNKSKSKNIEFDKIFTPLIQLKLVVDSHNNINSEPKIQSIIENIENVAIKMIKLIENLDMRNNLYKRFKISTPAEW